MLDETWISTPGRESKPDDSLNSLYSMISISSKLKLNMVLALLLAGITVAYCNHFSNEFHFDDSHTVVDNPTIRSLHNVPRFLTDASTFSVLPANQTYRPMVSASLALDYALGHGYVQVF